MKVAIFFISLVLLLVPKDIFAQRKKQDSEMVKLSSSVNFHPPSNEQITPEGFLGSDVLRIARPHQRVGVGFSYQKIKNNSLYKEISLNQLFISEYDRVQSIGNLNVNTLAISGERVKAFTISMKYEMGKYFGDISNNKLNFGIGIGLQSGYDYYNGVPYLVIGYAGAVAHIIDLDLIGSLNMIKNISKIFSIELKILPSIETSPYYFFAIRNPNVSINQQRQKRPGGFFRATAGASLHLRYTLSNTSMRGTR
jgi:hypothetical protein